MPRRVQLRVWCVTWKQRLKTQPNDIRRAEWEWQRNNAKREACDCHGKAGYTGRLG